MDEMDCIRIAKDANIKFESFIDIFYNSNSKFIKYKSNMEAAKQIKEFYSEISSWCSCCPK